MAITLHVQTKQIKEKDDKKDQPSPPQLTTREDQLTTWRARVRATLRRLPSATKPRRPSALDRTAEKMTVPRSRPCDRPAQQHGRGGG